MLVLVLVIARNRAVSGIETTGELKNPTLPLRHGLTRSLTRTHPFTLTLTQTGTLTL
ncbi:MAG: hypothetical protein ACREMQ_22510 [Longimicrobiales bacterium]